MKDGTGGDPFADDDPVDETTAKSESATASTESEPSTSATEPDLETTTSSSSTHQATTELPYIYARETVKEDRDQVPFFLREDIQELESDFIDELESILGEDVYKADAREAALQAVYENYVEETAALLREWGYGRT